jgi:Ca-activated chloride channel family protein
MKLVHFQHTEALIGLLLIPLLAVLFWGVIRWKKNTVKKIGDVKLVKELISDYSSAHFITKFVMAAVALAVIILGAASLQKPGNMDPVERKGVDVVIALDVSKSMLAQDIKPNRLEVARQFVYKLMDELKDDRVGLVLFAGRAYMQMPLTTDHSAAKMYVQTAGPEVVPTQGTVIADALKMSGSAFNSKERKYKAIILITDGEDHDPEALKTSLEMADNAVLVNTIGIGSAEGSPIVDPMTNEFKKDENGQTIISKLNEPELQQLAQTTKGIYIHLIDTNDAVKKIMAQLNTIQGTILEDSAFKNYKHYFQWFIAAALILLIVEFFFPERKWKIA